MLRSQNYLARPNLDVVINQNVVTLKDRLHLNLNPNQLPNPHRNQNPSPRIVRLKTPKKCLTLRTTYTYEDAQMLCKAYDAKLATYDQIEEAYNKGQNGVITVGLTTNLLCILHKRKHMQDYRK